VLIDRFIDEAIARSIEVVLNLGAGLDTRPYRMSLPASLLWCEVDLAPVIEHKETVLANESPRCRLRRVALDIVETTARQELLASLLGDETPALVLAEGVFPYLQPDDVARILDDLHARPAVQNLIVDYLSPELMRARSAMPLAHSSVAMPFVPEDWQGFFAARGWKVAQMGDLAEEGERHGRPFAMPEAMRAIAQGQAGARRPSAQGTFAAYALMERA
jgi:methyltransferase (TIGR00027 family)